MRYLLLSALGGAIYCYIKTLNGNNYNNNYTIDYDENGFREILDDIRSYKYI